MRNDDVFGLDVSMGDLLCVEIRDAIEDVPQLPACLILFKNALLL